MLIEQSNVLPTVRWISYPAQMREHDRRKIIFVLCIEKFCDGKQKK